MKRRTKQTQWHDADLLVPQWPQIAPVNWDRLRQLINTGLSAIGMKPVPATLEDCGQGEFQMEIAYGYSVYWDGKLLTLQSSIVIPGIRTLRNGDPGWPDDVDVSDVASFAPNQLADLARSASSHIAESLIDTHLEGFFEDEMFREQKGMGD